jgi:DNA-binding response OmpR family regulator
MSEKKILIVDDARELARALTVRLKSEGFRVEVAYDAIQGMAAAVSNPPDLIVLDLRLPGGSGYDILEKLKMMPATCDVPVVVFTASGQAGAAKALELGAAAYLTKPCESKVLITAIKDALETKPALPGEQDLLG